MPLSIKYSIVRKIYTSYRRPFSETAYITYQRSIRIQNTGVHGDVVHKNCICRSILRRAVGQRSVDKTGKPIELFSSPNLIRIC